MRRSFHFAGVVALAALMPGCKDGIAPSRTVTLNFAARYGTQTFSCGQSYTGVGTSASTISPRDLRFYVHNVRLVTAAGVEVPVALANDGTWQNGQVALLDLENGTGDCANGGTSTMRTTVTGQALEGNYRGLRFTVGVPFTQNHQDVAAAPAPLNQSSMFWGWNIGYIFFKLDVTTTGQPGGWSFHVGSTGCTPAGNAPTTCANPNRPEVIFADFQENQTITIDIAELLAQANVDVGPGCHSFPGTAACSAGFPRFGLAYESTPAGAQAVFKIGS